MDIDETMERLHSNPYEEDTELTTEEYLARYDLDYMTIEESAEVMTRLGLEYNTIEQIDCHLVYELKQSIKYGHVKKAESYYKAIMDIRR